MMVGAERLLSILFIPFIPVEKALLRRMKGMAGYLERFSLRSLCPMWRNYFNEHGDEKDRRSSKCDSSWLNSVETNYPQ